uniref:Uncharacterized protein n=1 Tax=Anguilla anguilla TaxID=7936 RepID=A0A0E9UI37_ANGAN
MMENAPRVLDSFCTLSPRGHRPLLPPAFLSSERCKESHWPVHLSKSCCVLLYLFIVH